VNKQENRSGNGRWLKGQTGNPSGRPITARTRISEKPLHKARFRLGNACGVSSRASSANPSWQARPDR
jgi:hypothetical protein